MNLTRRRALAAGGGLGATSLAGCLQNITNRSNTLSGDYEISDFVEREGTELQLDGEQYRYTGMMAQLTYTAPNRNKAWVNEAMEIANEYDIDAYRCWGFPAPGDDVPAPHQAPGEFNDEWISLFDYTVAKAKEEGIRLIVPLLQGVYNRTDRPDRYKEAPSPVAYGTWSDTTTYEGENTALFIEDEQANEYFKEYIEYFLTHENQYTGIEYRNEPTILFWECANELEYKHEDRAGDSLDFWYADIAEYIKSLDSNHLVSTGMNGATGEIYVSWYERCAYVQDHQVDAIDVCTFHDYPVYYGYEDGTVRIKSPELMRKYAEHKIRLAKEEIEKPVYNGEFGTLYRPQAETAYISRIESPESANDIEVDGFPPHKERKEAYEGVLTIREEAIDDQADLELRNEYFRHMTDVGTSNSLDGVQFWRLAANTGIGAPDPEERSEDDPLIVYPDDTTTLSVIRQYADRVLE